MNNSRLNKLLARQQGLKEAINHERRQGRLRKQKALFGAAKRAGLLDLTDDEIEMALREYQQTHNQNSNDIGYKS